MASTLSVMLWKYCASMMFSRAVRYGMRWNCWKMKPIFSARKRFNSAADICEMLVPWIQTSPLLGWSRQPIRLTRVDLPEPEGHMMASHSPDGTVSETEYSAHTSTLLL